MTISHILHMSKTLIYLLIKFVCLLCRFRSSELQALPMAMNKKVRSKSEELSSMNSEWIICFSKDMLI